MKPVFKCEYCDYMDTEEKVKEHELTCVNNYDRKSCFTCVHKGFKSLKQYKCALGKEIPEGKIFEFCPQYERKAEPETIDNLFSDLFGGFEK